MRCLIKHHALKTRWGSAGEWPASSPGRFTSAKVLRIPIG